MVLSKKKGWSLGNLVFLAMVLGCALGWLAAALGKASLVLTYVHPFGVIFVNLLKFIVVPIVLLSIICGMISLENVKKVGDIGLKTLVYYLLTTAVATIIGLAVAQLFKDFFPVLETTEVTFEAPSTHWTEVLIKIFPSNMWAAFFSANMLQVIVIALFLGAGILMAEDKGQAAAQWFHSLQDVFLNVMMMIIKITPLGVFCLMSEVVVLNGPSFLGPLAVVLGVAYLAYTLHVLVVYSAAVKGLGGLSPRAFFRGMFPAMVFAFTSTSSLATLPLTKECSKSLGADSTVSSFVLPLGATLNMDGTAIYMGVVSVFIACCYGITLTLGQMISIVLTATLASIGTAGVSGAGPIMLAMVLESVGLPVAGIGLIMGIDKVFDMGRSCLNVLGDASCTLVISHWERKKRQGKESSCG